MRLHIVYDGHAALDTSIPPGRTRITIRWLIFALSIEIDVA